VRWPVSGGFAKYWQWLKMALTSFFHHKIGGSSSWQLERKIDPQ
jgi:hypothetical protein